MNSDTSPGQHRSLLKLWRAHSHTNGKEFGLLSQLLVPAGGVVAMKPGMDQTPDDVDALEAALERLAVGERATVEWYSTRSRSRITASALKVSAAGWTSMSPYSG